MGEPAKRIARLGILTALGGVLLFLTNVLPAGRLGFMVLASFPVCCAVMMCGRGWAAAVFVATAALGLLLFPGAAAVGYAVFFGYYPIAKSLFERCRSRALTWGLKLGLYAAAFGVCWAAARALFGPAARTLPWYILLPLGAAAFAVYDWCYSLVIRLHIDKIARYIP